MFLDENTRLTGIYDDAKKAMNAADTAGAFKAAADMFAAIPGFKDADILARECRDKAETIRRDWVYSSALFHMNDEIGSCNEAIALLETIPGWKDADEQIIACQERIEEIRERTRLEAERKAEERRIAAEKAAEKRKKAFAVGIPVAAACIVFLIVLITVIIPKSKYRAAVSLMNDGRYSEAFTVFTALGGYRDSTDKASECLFSAQKPRLSGIQNGDIIKFGAYEQDGSTSDGKEEIEWIVLCAEGSKALVISKYALDCQPYNASYIGVSWEKCTLRTWLNGVFMNDAFSSKHQEMISSVSVPADNNPEYITDPGSAAADKVFLLSAAEAEKYFSTDRARQCQPTKTAADKGACTGSDNGSCWWWLRSPGDIRNYAVRVYDDGSVGYFGDDVALGSGAVRPALWIDLDS